MNLNASGSLYDAWLASACMPPDLTRRMLALFHDSKSCYNAFEQQTDTIQHLIPSRFRILLEKNRTDEYMIRMEKLMIDNSIQVLRYDDTEYPDALKMIEAAPAVLFFQGNLQCMKNRILAMVGSRAASYTGMKAARKLATDLSRNGVAVVSGMACGIDTASHRGCLEGGSPTIAVAANGLDTVYPKENIALRNEILSGNGLILSEYAPGEKPTGWHFPFRNRIIAGLGHALILMEARIRSGSMTSVQHALEQGKDVFVYPGDPASEHFEGNHQLLREGGIYFTSVEDILSDLDWLDNQTPVRQNIDCSVCRTALPPEQASVIQALKPGSLSFEQLLVQTNLDPPVLMSTLTIMQIGGVIESLPGKIYQLKH